MGWGPSPALAPEHHHSLLTASPWTETRVNCAVSLEGGEKGETAPQRGTYVDPVGGPRTKPATVALFNNPAVLTETGLPGCCGSLSIKTCTPQGPATPKARRVGGNSSAQNGQRSSQRLRPAPDPRRGVCTSADEHVARAAWKKAGTCSSGRIYVRVWHLDRKLLPRRAEQADSECSLNSTRSRSRGAGSAHQYGTSELHPSCNPAEEFSSAARKDESVLSGPPYHYYCQRI